MRGTRWLIVLAILAILGGVGLTYRVQRRFLQERAPPAPKQLPLELNSAAEDWEFVRTEGGRTVARITAKNVTQKKDKSKTELEQVKLRLFHKDGDAFDLIESAHGEFFPPEQRMYSDGEVQFTLGLPVEGQPRQTPVTIRSSAVTFDVRTGKAATDRPTSFIFEHGTGKCVGASYDPSTRELRMNSQVELHWKARGPHSQPMKLEGQQLVYREGGSTISLAPWARLTRDNAVIEAADTTVTLQEGVIQSINAQKAHGTDQYPNRRLQYAADHLDVNFSDTGVVRKVGGEANARLVSTSEGAETTMTADRVDLAFTETNGETALAVALATGNATVESKPLPVNGRLMPETRVLKSQIIDVDMRPGGKEIDKVETQAPGTLEFLPTRQGQHHRRLDGDRISMVYGARNLMQSFHASNARTQTDPTPEERAHNRTPSKTASKDLTAEFDPKNGQMTRMEQRTDFTYDEGDRKARAAHAIMEPGQNLITLETGARMWDSTGSTLADRIQVDQQSGNFHARGHVQSSRLPDKQKSGSEMLSGDEPLQAVADTMDSFNRNRLVHYEGKAVLWQGANRVQGDRVDIDREQRRLTASGNVVTQFQEEGEDDAAAVFTVVHAANLIYTEDKRLARYTGGVSLWRGGLTVKSRALTAYLAEQGADSRIEKAFADGQVQIVQTAPKRTRTGTSEHAEYYTDEEKIILNKGEPQLVDSVEGITRGAELTYFANDDRLLVNGAPDRPATSRIRRK